MMIIEQSQGYIFLREGVILITKELAASDSFGGAVLLTWFDQLPVLATYSLGGSTF